MAEIIAHNITKSYTANKVLHNLSLEIYENEHVGIIGANGSGKSTFLKMILGKEIPDIGTIELRKNRIFGYIEQVPAYSQQTLCKTILEESFQQVFAVEKQLRLIENKLADPSFSKSHSSLLNQYAQLTEKYEALGGYTTESKILNVLKNLNLSDSTLDQPFESLSGGEKTRILLAKVMLQKADVLLLDEPTNNLDLDSLSYLEEFLIQFKGTYLVVSHDRYFLDKVTTRILEFGKTKALSFQGNYSTYFSLKEKMMEKQSKDFHDQKKEIKDLQEAVSRYRQWGSISGNEKFFKRASAIENRIDKMERIDKPDKENGMKLLFKESRRSGKDVIVCSNITKTFNHKNILKSVSFHLLYQSRSVIIGKNGSGKSTILRIINGLDMQDSGTLNIGASVVIGYLPQTITFENPDITVLDFTREIKPYEEHVLRRILFQFKFSSEDVFKRINGLSGGEKVRLKLMQLMMQNVNFLILDEPTNHIDLESRAVLESALNDFNGTVLCVSHDRFFINSIADTIYELNNGTLEKYNGNYDYYLEKKK